MLTYQTIWSAERYPLLTAAGNRNLIISARFVSCTTLNSEAAVKMETIMMNLNARHDALILCLI